MCTRDARIFLGWRDRDGREKLKIQKFSISHHSSYIYSWRNIAHQHHLQLYGVSRINLLLSLPVSRLSPFSRSQIFTQFRTMNFEAEIYVNWELVSGKSETSNLADVPLECSQMWRTEKDKVHQTSPIISSFLGHIQDDVGWTGKKSWVFPSRKKLKTFFTLLKFFKVLQLLTHSHTLTFDSLSFPIRKISFVLHNCPQNSSSIAPIIISTVPTPLPSSHTWTPRALPDNEVFFYGEQNTKNSLPIDSVPGPCKKPSLRAHRKILFFSTPQQFHTTIWSYAQRNGICIT